MVGPLSRRKWNFSLDRPDNGTVEIEAVRGDITKQQVDAVVNAANQSLAGGGGVDGAIHRAAGARDLHEACARLGGCPTGDVRATDGFRLPARWIIHAVGPRYRDGRRGEPDLLASCYVRALAVADELGARSLAFPAISTGIYGYPLVEATDIAVATVTGATTDVELVRFVCFDDATLRVYERRINAPSS
ncbi:MAG TPA: O-acetyl-ADP-ribose deacetylase [Acidimicrobiia bacterium]|jgi:O-acetyl-ADP-ribose deacetylase (regulator of RNase III)|nr:O-acetyl-ADP-ribose deacetylase [Acidimicrobiia bacterium]